MREGAARRDGLVKAVDEDQRCQKAVEQPGLDGCHFVPVFVCWKGVQLACAFHSDNKSKRTLVFANGRPSSEPSFRSVVILASSLSTPSTQCNRARPPQTNTDQNVPGTRSIGGGCRWTGWAKLTTTSHQATRLLALSKPRARSSSKRSDVYARTTRTRRNYHTRARTQSRAWQSHCCTWLDACIQRTRRLWPVSVSFLSFH
jgi:hypothetical protein